MEEEEDEESSESSSNPDEDSKEAYEDLFAAVMAATDPSDSSRFLHSAFQLKPSKKVKVQLFPSKIQM